MYDHFYSMYILFFIRIQSAIRYLVGKICIFSEIFLGEDEGIHNLRNITKIARGLNVTFRNLIEQTYYLNLLFCYIDPQYVRSPK